jgi:hypothetical protein
MRNKQPRIKALRIQLPPFIQRAVAHTIWMFKSVREILASSQPEISFKGCFEISGGACEQAMKFWVNVQLQKIWVLRSKRCFRYVCWLLDSLENVKNTVLKLENINIFWERTLKYNYCIDKSRLGLQRVRWAYLFFRLRYNATLLKSLNLKVVFERGSPIHIYYIVNSLF